MSSLVTGFQTCALPIYLTDLFTTKPKPPLAELLRPKTLDEFVGQRHLLGPGKPLRLAFEAGKLHEFILWGPPGGGKTTLGRQIGRAAGGDRGCQYGVVVGEAGAINTTK